MGNEMNIATYKNFVEIKPKKCLSNLYLVLDEYK